jgi:hypothetical protein
LGLETEVNIGISEVKNEATYPNNRESENVQEARLLLFLGFAGFETCVP